MRSFYPKSSLIALTLAMGSGTVSAAPASYTPIGTNIGYGDSANPNSLYHALVNPANNNIHAADIEGARYGLGATAQIQLESDGLEGAETYLDDNIKQLLDDNRFEDVDRLQTNVNQFMRHYDAGNISAIGGVTVPLVIKHEALGGGLSFDYTRQVGIKTDIIRRGDVSANYVNNNLGIDAGDAAIGVHYKELSEFALGYGRTLYQQANGALSVGITARYIDILANSRAVDFSEIANDNVGGADKDTEDYIDDIETGPSDSNITADVGLHWTAEHYMLGLVGMNLTAPSFDVNDRSNNQINGTFGIDDTFQLDPQFRASAQWFNASREWTLAGSFDLNEAHDLNNEPTQWWSTTASYATNQAWYLPDVRIGLRGNLAGSGYTYGTFGLTLGFVTLDMAATTTDFSGVADDQEDAGVMASMGIEFDF